MTPACSAPGRNLRNGKAPIPSVVTGSAARAANGCPYMWARWFRPMTIAPPALSSTRRTSTGRPSPNQQPWRSTRIRTGLPDPQFWVAERKTTFPSALFLLAFKDVTATTNIWSMIAALLPADGVGNTLPLIISDGDSQLSTSVYATLLANLNATPFDFVARQKIQGQHLNWYLVVVLSINTTLSDLARRRQGKLSARRYWN